MTVKELINILKGLEQDAVIDLAGDEEGNYFGDIDESLAEGEMLDGRKIYTLYPLNTETGEERYRESEEVCHLCGSEETAGGWCTNETCSEFTKHEE